MRSRSADCSEEIFEVFLSFKIIFVVDRHFRQADYLFALLQKRLDADILSKRMQRV